MSCCCLFITGSSVQQSYVTLLSITGSSLHHSYVMLLSVHHGFFCTSKLCHTVYHWFLCTSKLCHAVDCSSPVPLHQSYVMLLSVHHWLSVVYHWFLCTSKLCHTVVCLSPVPLYIKAMSHCCLFITGSSVHQSYVALLSVYHPFLCTSKLCHAVVCLSMHVQFWHVDHIRPVWDGGGQCDIDNLRTLCTPCHQAVTAQQAAKRAQARRLSKAACAGDITAFFKRA